MAGGRTLLLVLLLLGGCGKFGAEPATLDEIIKVVEALRAAGCTAVLEIDVDRDGYEAEGVTCNRREELRYEARQELRRRFQT